MITVGVFINNTRLAMLTCLTYLSILGRLSIVYGTHQFLICNYESVDYIEEFLSYSSGKCFKVSQTSD